MKKFNNLSELISFVEGIPEERFVQRYLGTSPEQACVMGQINYHLHGNTSSFRGDAYSPSTTTNLEEIGVNVHDLIRANNHSELGPKQGSLSYLKSLQL